MNKEEYPLLLNRIKEALDKIRGIDDYKQALVLFGLIGAMQGICKGYSYLDPYKDPFLLLVEAFEELTEEGATNGQTNPSGE